MANCFYVSTVAFPAWVMAVSNSHRAKNWSEKQVNVFDEGTMILRVLVSSS